MCEAKCVCFDQHPFQVTGSPIVSWLIVSSIVQVSAKCRSSIGEVLAKYRRSVAEVSVT